MIPAASWLDLLRPKILIGNPTGQTMRRYRAWRYRRWWRGVERVIEAEKVEEVEHAEVRRLMKFGPRVRYEPEHVHPIRKTLIRFFRWVKEAKKWIKRNLKDNSIVVMVTKEDFRDE